MLSTVIVALNFIVVMYVNARYKHYAVTESATETPGQSVEMEVIDEADRVVVQGGGSNEPLT